MLIRDIEPGDFEDILRINADSQPGVFALSTPLLTQIRSEASLAWVAMTGELIAGYLLGYSGSVTGVGEEFEWFRRQLDNFVYVDQIAVARSQRGRGVAGGLYLELESWSRRRGYGWLTCEVNLHPPNPQSLAFHRRHGFREVGNIHTADARHVALLQKQIIGPARETAPAGGTA